MKETTKLTIQIWVTLVVGIAMFAAWVGAWVWVGLHECPKSPDRCDVPVVVVW